MDCDDLDECYTGNTLLLGVARLFHIQVDQLNFILSQIVAVFPLAHTGLNSDHVKF